MMCQCRFTFGKKYTILVSDVDNRGSYACVGAGVHGKSLYPLLNFVVTALKRKPKVLYMCIFKTQHVNTRLKELNLSHSIENWRAKKGSEGIKQWVQNFLTRKHTH